MNCKIDDDSQIRARSSSCESLTINTVTDQSKLGFAVWVGYHAIGGFVRVFDEKMGNSL
jgi:hypothetical protein